MDSKTVLDSSTFPSAMLIDDYKNGASQRIWNGPFSFILGADPQFGMIGACKLKSSVPTWHPEMVLTRETIKKVNAMTPKPRFFLVCGDMLDAFPFDKKDIRHYNNNDQTVRDQQYVDFMKIFREELDPEIRLIFACGNHDIGDYPTAVTLEKYRKEFGPDYFTFWVGGVKFIVLNSQFFFAPEAVPEETEKHDKWMEQHIPDKSAKHIVVFQHIPFFGNNPEEENLYCNIPKARRLVILEKLFKLGVRYIFCGHYHKNAGGKYKNIEQVVSGPMGAAFGDDPSGYRVVHVGNFDVTHEYVKLRETTECDEFEVDGGENDDPDIDETKSLTPSERVRRRRLWMWSCCGGNMFVDENGNDETYAPSSHTL